MIGAATGLRMCAIAAVLTALAGTSGISSATASTQHVGHSLVLHGYGGQVARVTVLKVVAPAKVGQYDEPSAGKRFVAVNLRIKNIGKKKLDQNMRNSSTLIYAGGRQTSPTIVSGGPCAEFGSVIIMPGSYRQGCVVFEVPKGKLPKVFQFGLDSGYADETGEWNL